MSPASAAGATVLPGSWHLPKHARILDRCRGHCLVHEDRATEIVAAGDAGGKACVFGPRRTLTDTDGRRPFGLRSASLRRRERTLKSGVVSSARGDGMPSSSRTMGDTAIFAGMACFEDLAGHAEDEEPDAELIEAASIAAANAACVTIASDPDGMHREAVEQLVRKHSRSS